MSTISNSLRLGEDGFIWPTGSESAGNHAPQYDYELARRVSLGDIPAFEELYQRHQRRVYSLCLRMTNNIPEAEDLTQEVFIHLFHKIGSFRGDSAIRAAADARAKVEVELSVARAKMLSQIGAVLTSEQKAQIEARRQRASQRPKPPQG